MSYSAYEQEKAARKTSTPRRTSAGPNFASRPRASAQPPTKTSVKPSRTQSTVTSAHQPASATNGHRPSFARAAIQSSTQPLTVEPTYPALEMTIWRNMPGTYRDSVAPPWSGLMRIRSTDPPTSSVARACELSCISTTSSLNG